MILRVHECRAILHIENGNIACQKSNLLYIKERKKESVEKEREKYGFFRYQFREESS